MLDLDIFGNIFGDDDFDFSSKITVKMRNPAGHIETLHKDEAADFEHDNEVYMIKEPFIDPETGKRYLGYDKGNPVPWFHEGYNPDDDTDPSIDLMDENYASSMIRKLSKVPSSAGMDIIGQLQRIPPWVYVFILAVIVLLNQGALGGLIPFF